MIELYQFPPMWGLPNFSPFCLKLETWLRMAKLPYQAPKCGIPLGKAPKHKLPYIVDRGQSIGDSSLIIDYLKATYGDTLDNGLSPQQQAVSLAFQRLIEENLYWPVLYSRWLDPRNRQIIARKVFARLPPLIRDLVPLLVRRKMRRDMLGQGIGRHSAAEIYAIGCRDLDAVALFLDDKPFFWGETPTSIDAVVFGFIANLLWAPIANPIKAHAASYPQLDAYCRRMWARYYPELPLPPAAG